MSKRTRYAVGYFVCLSFVILAFSRIHPDERWLVWAMTVASFVAGMIQARERR